MPAGRESHSFRSVVNYLRRSRQDLERERRTGEDTLAEQKGLMDRVLAAYGIPYEQRMEIGSGDRISTRPVFQSVLRELEDGRFDAIAVKEISRLGRGSYTDMGQIYDLLRERRICIITPWRVYDPTNSADARQIRFELFLSREEFETTRERLLGARYNYAMQGKWMAGAVPYGYRFDVSSQRLVPHELEAEVVRKVFDWYAFGLHGELPGVRAIAKELTRLGHLTASGKSRWHPQVVRRMLGKAVYAGEVRFRITMRARGTVRVRPESDWIVVPEAHPGIVPRKTFDTVLRRLSSRGAGAREGSGPSAGRSALAGIVTCGLCGGRLLRHVSVRRHTARDGSVRVYRTLTLRCPLECSVAPYAPVEAALSASLRHLPGADRPDFSDRVARNRLAAGAGLETEEATHAGIDTVADAYGKLRREMLRNRLLRAVVAEARLLPGTGSEGHWRMEVTLRPRPLF